MGQPVAPTDLSTVRLADGTGVETRREIRDLVLLNYLINKNFPSLKAIVFSVSFGNSKRQQNILKILSNKKIFSRSISGRLRDNKTKIRAKTQEYPMSSPDPVNRFCLLMDVPVLHFS